jgi:hypothetical protein
VAKQDAGFASIAADGQIIKYKHDTMSLRPAFMCPAVDGRKKRGRSLSLWIMAGNVLV